MPKSEHPDEEVADEVHLKVYKDILRKAVTVSIHFRMKQKRLSE